MTHWPIRLVASLRALSPPALDKAGSQAKLLFSSVPHDFALASRTVFYGMAAVMAVAFVVALVAMPGGKVEEQVEDEPGAGGSLAGPA